MVNSSLYTKTVLNIGEKQYSYFSLTAAGKFLGIDVSRLPCSLKVLLENLLRNEDGVNVILDDIKILASCTYKYVNHEIGYRPARVLMQDFTGVPALVDLASMRSYLKKNINPSMPVDLVIDHSVQVDSYGGSDSFDKNVELEIERNSERYQFLKWGQASFKNFRVVPPGTGICHQVNLEYLAQVVCNNDGIVYPDTLIGTDSHTTMVNGLSVLGWGVGGIEAESVMLGQAISMIIPEVTGVKLIGALVEGVTATDLVLTITNILRKKGVVGKFVEFYGRGLDNLSIPDRATIANMAPEYGATCGFFPIDDKTLNYLHLTGRPKELIDLVECYAKKQGLWANENIVFFDEIELDLSSIEPVIAGPKRPQDKIYLSQVADSFFCSFEHNIIEKNNTLNGELEDGSIVIAAITSCTNTSNPHTMIAAGLVARNAVKLGLRTKPWVKTSLAPGSKVVTEYLAQSGLRESLDNLGFNLVGYGCTTCIGNSGPLNSEVESDIKERNLIVAAVLSGNRNFEGRIHPLVKANYLASPPLIVVYALAGNIRVDLTKDPIGKDQDGNDIYLQDIWPTSSEVEDYVSKVITREMFIKKYQDVFSGDKYWQEIKCEESQIYNWNTHSTYIQNPPYFDNILNNDNTVNIQNAQILAILGDSVTTDHISPAGNIAINSPAGMYLKDLGIEYKDFNSYGSRRGNHNVMVRGTFSNIRIKNEMVDVEGGYTKYMLSGEQMSIFDAATRYDVPLIILAGKEYGTGSSRDWAAKGTALLGVKAVIAESFERIHRSNLVGMGVLPLMFECGITRKVFNSSDIVSIRGEIAPNANLECIIENNNYSTKRSIQLKCCIATTTESEYIKSGGVLHYILRNNY